MSKSKKLIRNIIILFVFVIFNMIIFNLSLSPTRAFRAAERSLHYGPSEIIHIEDYDGRKFILGKYDKWYSCVPVRREFLFFWRVVSHSHGSEIDESQVMNYGYGGAEGTYYFNGIINDDSLEKVEITLRSGEVYSETEFHDDLFLLTIESEEAPSSRMDLRYIRGYDIDDNIIYEDILY